MVDTTETMRQVALTTALRSSLPEDVEELLISFSRERTTAEILGIIKPVLEAISWERWMSIGMSPMCFLHLLTKYKTGDPLPLSVRGMPNPTPTENQRITKAYKWLSWGRMEL